ncbi:hypothetical protein GCM10025867_26830 [Frondihabitans sucicola]|uniref:FtsQ-type POTRA domain-containing protein n=1 Tax=Frondihabitans sucicola TaxID=1268041 RepID=A0ABM8GPR6_9MICO|nr:hypothetical protein [Frondihabitans sucicola]BDZ50442.1 hypothetical protein GCM10025867_26830 [Frondihabitans sucicola]
MKRPEGFDRLAAKAASPKAPSAPQPDPRVEASGSAPGVKTSAPETTRAEPAPAAASAPATEPAGPAERRDPAYLTPPRSSPAEARDRARASRRLARRAAAARRAVERTEVRRFTRRSRHRRAAWITAGAVVVVLVGSVTISVFSPLLSLQSVKVEGTSRVDKAAVQKSLDQQLGKPLALIDFSAVKADLSNFP